MENLFRKEDREFLDNLLAFTTGLVIHDTELAENYETNASLRNASAYIGAYYKFDNNSDDVRENIRKGYKDLNKYYAYLQSNYDIEPALARMAKDLSLLKSTKNTISKEDEKLFYDCYYECLSYYKTVTSTKAFNNQPDKKKFIKLFLIWSSIQKFLTRKMDTFFNIDLYDERTLKNCFISLGLDYFDNLPLQYQRKLLKNINDIIKTKGTNKCIINILNSFGMNDTGIYKYILTKGYITNTKVSGDIEYEPYLTFYKVPYNKDIDCPESLKMNYEDIIKDDIYWDATEEEILQEDFNIITTKYLSVDSIIDINKDTLNLSYFLYLLKYLEENYSNKIDLSFLNTKISSNKISLYDGFISIIVLVSKLSGYKDLINNRTDSINYIYGYNNIDEKLNISELIDDIVFGIYNAPDIPNKEVLIKFFRNFKLKNFEANGLISIDKLLEVFKYNENLRHELENVIKNTHNKKLLDNVKLLYDISMKSKISKSMFSNFNTFSDYIKSKDQELYMWLQATDDILDDDEKRFYYFRDKLFEITSSISNFIYDDELTNAINKNPYIGIDGYLQYYIQTLIALFKSYTIDILNAGLVYRIDDPINDKINLIDNINNMEYNSEEAEFLGLYEDIKLYKGSYGQETEIDIAKGER